MAKFRGSVGFVGEDVETRPGVWEESVVEKPYFGDVLSNSRQLLGEDKVNSDISVSNSISIVADTHLREHFIAIRYVRWMGGVWRVADARVEGPRIILRLGGVYGKKASTP